MKYNTKGNEVTEKEKADKVKAIIEKNEKEVTIFILKRKIKFLELEVLQAQILKNNKGTKDEEKIKKMWQQIELFDEVTLALEELEGSDYPDEISDYDERPRPLDLISKFDEKMAEFREVFGL